MPPSRFEVAFAPKPRMHRGRSLFLTAGYGPSHLTVALHLNNLGLVLRDLGEFAAARAALERAAQIFQTFLGVEHPSTKTAQAHLNAVIRASGTPPATA